MDAIEYHEYANLFPMLDSESLESLADDIAEHGQSEPIWLYQGKILDGRNRFVACQMRGVEPVAKEYLDDRPIQFVVSRNLKRRMLTPSQAAMVGAKIQEAFAAEAKLRQKEAGGDRKSEKVKKQEEKSVSANLREPISEKSSSLAGKAVGVSGRSIEHASQVIRDGVPELAEAVEAGKMKVSRAAKIAKLSHEEQAELLKSGGPLPKAPEPADDEADEADELDPPDLVAKTIGEQIRELDRIKQSILAAAKENPLYAKYVHVESVTSRISEVRKTLYQSRPSEECKCVNGGKPKSECRACHGTGKCAAFHNMNHRGKQ